MQSDAAHFTPQLYMIKHRLPYSYFIFLLLGLSLGWAACTETTEDIDLDYGYEYFPLRLGQTLVYEVDSVVYDDFTNTIDTVQFQLREITLDTFRDGENILNYRIERQVRSDENAAWQFKQIVAARRTSTKAERMEGNQRYLNLVFPARLGNSWDGNAYLDQDTIYTIRNVSIEIYKGWEDFSYTQLDEAYQLNGFNFDSTLLVQQVDYENLIELRSSVERYAKGIGLVYKELKILDTQCGGNLAACQGLSWEEKAEKGFIYRMRLIAHD